MYNTILLNIEFTKAILEIIIMLLVAFLLGVITHWMMFRSSREKESDESVKEEYNLLRNKYEMTIDDRNEIQKSSELLIAEVNKLKLKNQRLEKADLERMEEIKILENKLVTAKLNLPENTTIIASGTLEDKETEVVVVEKNAENPIQTSEISMLVNEEKETDTSNFERAENAAIIEYLKSKELASDTDKDNIMNSENESFEVNEIVKIEPNKSSIVENIEEDASVKLNRLLGTIGNSSNKDDLKQIHGIGPFIEEKLNSLGINSFLQISKLQDHDIDVLNDLIQFFPGRIQRDRWVEQAKSFLS